MEIKPVGIGFWAKMKQYPFPPLHCYRLVEYSYFWGTATCDQGLKVRALSSTPYWRANLGTNCYF